MLFAWFETDDLLFLSSFHDATFAGYIKDAFDIRHAPPLPEVRFYRPLHSTAFLLLYSVAGLNAAAYHAWSLGVHLFNTGMVWIIAGRLTKRALVAGLAAAFFALHPAYAPAVAWISNNNALMATAASLFAFWCFMNAEESRTKGHWYWVSAGSFGAALLFHPESGTMIAVLVAYRLLLGEREKRTRQWRNWAAFVPFVVIALGYLTIHRWMLHHHFLPQAESFDISPHMIKLYLSYFSISLFPVSAVERAGESVHQTVFAIAMLGLLAILVYQAVARGQRVAGVAVFWYLVALAPLSTGSGKLLSELIDGRKLYVAGPALAFVLALLVAPAVHALAASSWRTGRAVLVVACLAVVSLAGWRVVTYQNQVTSAADQSETFISQLQTTYPEISPGSRLYVTSVPPIFTFAPGLYLDGIVGLYYDDVEVVPDFDGTLPPLQPGDLVFRYQPNGTAAP